jgi:mitogen-activated protein kinase 1/3
MSIALINAPTAEGPAGFGFHPQPQVLEHSEHMELPEDYCVEDFLGSGAYGTVCSVRIKSTQELVAIKKCKKIFSSKTLAKRTLREMKLLRFMNHPNIVHLRTILVPNHRHTFDEVYLVFEQLDTDLAQIIRSPQRLNVDHIQYFMCQLLSALEYLHDANIIHRDLK